MKVQLYCGRQKEKIGYKIVVDGNPVIAHNSTLVDGDINGYEGFVKALIFGLRGTRTYLESTFPNDVVDLDLMVYSTPVGRWVERGICPDQYRESFSELTKVLNRLTVSYRVLYVKKNLKFIFSSVVMRESKDQKVSSVMDLLEGDEGDE